MPSSSMLLKSLLISYHICGRIYQQSVYFQKNIRNGRSPKNKRTPDGFPYEGKLSPEATDEVDCAA